MKLCIFYNLEYLDYVNFFWFLEEPKENEKMKSEEQTIDSENHSIPNALEETTVKIEKEDEKELVKLPVIVKLEKPLPESEEKKIIKEESDSFKENVKPIKVEVKESRADRSKKII